MPVADEVIVQLEARVNRYNADVRRAEQNFTESMRRTQREAGVTESRVEDSFRGIAAAALRAGAASVSLIALARAIRGVARAGDDLRNLEGRLTALTGSSTAGAAALQGVFDVADRTGAPLDAVASAIARYTLAAQDLGRTQGEVERLTETVLKLGRIGGSSSQELAAGAIQLGQALASGVLQGDELRSVLENIPLVARAIADGLGVGVGELREMAQEGQLTADKVFGALLRGAEEVDRKFAELPVTVEQAANRAAAAWSKFTAELDESLGISRTLSSVLESVASGIEESAQNLRTARQFREGLRGEELQNDIIPDLVEARDRAAEQLRRAEGVSAGIAQRMQIRLDEATRELVEARQELESLTLLGGPGPRSRPRVENIQTPEENPLAPRTTGAPRRAPADLGPEPERPSRGGRRAPREREDESAVRFLESIRERIQLRAEERALIGLTQRDQEVLRAGFDRERAATELLNLAKRENTTITPQQVEEGLRLIEVTEQLTISTIDLAEAERAAKERSEDLQRGIEDVGNRFASAIQQADSFTDALKRIGIEIANLLVQGLGGAGPLGSVLGGIIPSLFGGVGAGPAFGARLGPQAVLYAAGGVHGGTGPRALPRSMSTYSRGGISDEPAIFGEGPMAEAAVPLPDGRRIPVDLRIPTPRPAAGPSAGGGGMVINQNIDARGAQQGVAAQIARALEEYDRELPGRIRNSRERGLDR